MRGRAAGLPLGPGVTDWDQQATGGSGKTTSQHTDAHHHTRPKLPLFKASKIELNVSLLAPKAPHADPGYCDERNTSETKNKQLTCYKKAILI